MNFLKKFGQVVANIAGIAAGIGPVFAQYLPKSGGVITGVTSEIGMFAGVIGMIQGIGESIVIPGPDKLKAAAPQIAQVILASAFMAGKEIADPALFQQAMTEYAQATVDMMKSLHDKAVVVIKPQDVK